MSKRIMNFIEINGISEDLPQNVKVFKYISTRQLLELQEDMSDLRHLIRTYLDISIVNTIVTRDKQAGFPKKTKPAGPRAEIEAEIKQKIEYLSSADSMSVCIAFFQIPIYTSIVLPESFPGSSVPVKTYVDNVYMESLSSRSIVEHINILFNAEL